MITEFGRWTRTLRIEKDELLADMAKKLDVTPSFLSAVENGKRKIPKSWEKNLLVLYNLNDDDVAKLQTAINNSADVVKIDTRQFDRTENEIVHAFARRFQELDAEKKKKIKEILDGAK